MSIVILQCGVHAAQVVKERPFAFEYDKLSPELQERQPTLANKCARGGRCLGEPLTAAGPTSSAAEELAQTESISVSTEEKVALLMYYYEHECSGTGSRLVSGGTIRCSNTALSAISLRKERSYGCRCSKPLQPCHLQRVSPA